MLIIIITNHHHHHHHHHHHRHHHHHHQNHHHHHHRIIISDQSFIILIESLKSSWVMVGSHQPRSLQPPGPAIWAVHHPDFLFQDSGNVHATSALAHAKLASIGKEDLDHIAQLLQFFLDNCASVTARDILHTHICLTEGCKATGLGKSQ